MSPVTECLIIANIFQKNSTVGFLCQVIYFGYNFCLINRGFSSDLEGVRTSRGAVVELG